MNMRVLNTAGLPIRIVDSIVNGHASRHKILGDEPSCKFHVFFHGKFVLQRKIEAVSQLCIRSFFSRLDSIPECLSVSILCRSLRCQDDIGKEDSTFFRVVIHLIITVTVQSFSGSIGGTGNSTTAGTPLDLCNRKMIKGHQLPPSSAVLCLSTAA